MTVEHKQTAGVAVASLVLGILGFILIGPLGSIPAVICGHIAKSKIKKTPGALTGDGMALAGLILGYVQIGIMMLFIVPITASIAIPSFVKAREISQRSACLNNMRQIDSAKEQWALAEKKMTGDNPDINAINEYIKGAPLICPAGGTYEYKQIGEEPKCSIHGALSDNGY